MFKDLKIKKKKKKEIYQYHPSPSTTTIVVNCYTIDKTHLISVISLIMYV
jgi:hypothetical protein